MELWYPGAWHINFVGDLGQVGTLERPAREAIKRAFEAVEGHSPMLFLAFDPILQRAAISEGRRSSIAYHAVIILTGGAHSRRSWEICPLIREGQPQALPVHVEHDRDHWPLLEHLAQEHGGRRHQKALVVYSSEEGWPEKLARELQEWLYNRRVEKLFEQIFDQTGLAGVWEEYILRADVPSPLLYEFRLVTTLWRDFLDNDLQERIDKVSHVVNDYTRS